MSILPDDYPNQCRAMKRGKRCQNDGWILRGDGTRLCRDCYVAQVQADEKREVHLAIDDQLARIVPRHAGESGHEWSMRCREYTLSKLKAGSAARRPPLVNGMNFETINISDQHAAFLESQRCETLVQNEPGELG